MLRVVPLSKKILPRRANHWHTLIIAEISSPRRETGGGLFELDYLNPDVSNRTAAAMRDATFLTHTARGVAKRLPSELPFEHVSKEMLRVCPETAPHFALVF
jgi:hypothetical protein